MILVSEALALWADAAMLGAAGSAAEYGRSMCRPILEMDRVLVHLLTPVEVNAMQFAITEAKARLTDLVRRAEAGEEIVDCH